MQQNNLHTNESLSNNDDLDNRDAVIDAVCCSDPRFFGNDELSEQVKAALTSRSWATDHIPGKVLLMIERYDAVCRHEMETLAGVFSWPELVVLLNANPTDTTCLSSLSHIEEWPLCYVEDTPLEEDPGLPLAKKLAQLTLAQKVALCDALEKMYVRSTEHYEPGSTNFFGLQLAETLEETEGETVMS